MRCRRKPPAPVVKSCAEAITPPRAFAYLVRVASKAVQVRLFAFGSAAPAFSRCVRPCTPSEGVFRPLPRPSWRPRSYALLWISLPSHPPRCGGATVPPPSRCPGPTVSSSASRADRSRRCLPSSSAASMEPCSTTLSIRVVWCGSPAVRTRKAFTGAGVMALLKLAPEVLPVTK